MEIRVDAWNGVLSCLHGDPKAVLSLLQVDSLFCWLLSSQAFSTTASLSVASNIFKTAPITCSASSLANPSVCFYRLFPTRPDLHSLAWPGRS